MGRGKTQKTRLKRELDSGDAVSLRVQGFTYVQIGTMLGVSNATAYRMVSDELAKKKLETAEKIDEVRSIELERLDDYTTKLQGRLDKGDPKAVEAALKIQARRSKLLGLDSAIEVAVKAESLDDNTLIARLREALGTGTPGSGNPTPSGG